MHPGWPVSGPRSTDFGGPHGAGALDSEGGHEVLELFRRLPWRVEVLEGLLGVNEDKNKQKRVEVID